MTTEIKFEEHQTLEQVQKNFVHILKMILCSGKVMTKCHLKK
jgi:hypothetical protein